MRGTSWIILVIIASLVGLGVFFFLLLFERVEGEVETGPTGEALVNPLLAADRLLEKMGLETLSGDARLIDQALEDNDAVLVFLEGGTGLDEKKVYRIFDWVEAGGTVMVAFPKSRGDDEAGEAIPDHLLAGYDVSVYDAEDESPILTLEWERDQRPGTYEANLQGDGFILYTEEDLQYLGDEKGPRIVFEPYGEGKSILLASGKFLTNAMIGEHDHARLFYDLVAAGDPSKVFLVYRQEFPTIWAFLPRKAWMFLITLALLMLVGFLVWSPRFGPVASLPSPNRRRITEHISASSLFLWRLQGRTKPSGDQPRAILVKSARDRLSRTVERRHPRWSLLPREEYYARLGDLSGLGAEAAEHMMTGESPRTEEQFTRFIQNLETMRRVI